MRAAAADAGAALLLHRKTRLQGRMMPAARPQKGLEQVAERDQDRRLRQEGFRTILHWSMTFCRKQCRAKVRLIDNA